MATAFIIKALSIGFEGGTYPHVVVMSVISLSLFSDAEISLTSMGELYTLDDMVG